MHKATLPPISEVKPRVAGKVMKTNFPKASKLSTRKRASAMTIPELAELTKYFDQEFISSTPLTKADRKELSTAARKGKGRP